MQPSAILKWRGRVQLSRGARLWADSKKLERFFESCENAASNAKLVQPTRSQSLEVRKSLRGACHSTVQKGLAKGEGETLVCGLAGRPGLTCQLGAEPFCACVRLLLFWWTIPRERILLRLDY